MENWVVLQVQDVFLCSVDGPTDTPFNSHISVEELVARSLNQAVARMLEVACQTSV